jgi:predicted nucleotidyltransferase
MAGMAPEPVDLTQRLRAAVAGVPGLTLLLLHGSRARGAERPESDWDFAYLGDPDLDVDALLAILAETLGADRVDLADLARSGALLRFCVAEKAVVLFERETGVFERFWLDAVHTWCDLAPILLPSYEAVLDQAGAT